MRKAKKLCMLLLAFSLLFAASSAETADSGDLDVEEVIEEIELEDENSTLGWAEDIEFHRVNEWSPVQKDEPLNYWNMQMGWMDEKEIWQVLQQPVTVLKGNQRQQEKVRVRPEEDCEEYAGCVTYDSQGVHVLERGEEWSMIEAYSSSTEGSSVRVYAKLFQGWVRTELLEEKPVDDTYGLVIDKQFQRMYVFEKGKLKSTMLVSTGYAKKSTPWNETPAGEFLAVSWTGDFWSGDLYCRNAMRINDGILIHEVPCKERTDSAGNTSWDYSRCERYLGEKASHGCIRVQRNRTPEGVNEEWLWKNLNNPSKKNGGPCVKVIIWDDAGRTLGYPDDGLKLYYNTKHDTKHYHASPECVMIRNSSKTISILYGELQDGSYQKLTACPCCNPQPTHAAIDTLNEKNNR